MRDVWLENREQRDWVHRLANVLHKLPKRLQGNVQKGLREMMNAPTRKAAERGIDRFETNYGEKYAVPDGRGALATPGTFAPAPLRAGAGVDFHDEKRIERGTPRTGRPPPDSCLDPQLLTNLAGASSA